MKAKKPVCNVIPEGPEIYHHIQAAAAYTEQCRQVKAASDKRKEQQQWRPARQRQKRF